MQKQYFSTKGGGSRFVCVYVSLCISSDIFAIYSSRVKVTKCNSYKKNLMIETKGSQVKLLNGIATR